MICYKDKTWCVANCAVESCSRKLTKKVHEDARRWWGGQDAPIAVADFSEDCKSYVEQIEE